VLLVSWIAAVVACLAYGVATVLQSVGARRAATATGVGGVVGIVTQLPYLAGLALDGVGFVGNVVALRQLPLFLVEAIVAGSVGVTAVLAALRGERLRGRDWAALGVLGLGLVLLSISAAPAEASATSLTRDWLILGCALLPLVVGLVGYRTGGPSSVVLLAVAAGLGFSGVAVASRAMGADPITWGLLLNPLLWAIIAYGALAVGFFGVALQRGKITVVAAVTFVIEVIVPSALGLLFFGDGIADGRLPYAVAGFVLAIGGTVALSRFAE
jgi:drug/metabolite transporter (DMT)-like permease